MKEDFSKYHIPYSDVVFQNRVGKGDFFSVSVSSFSRSLFVSLSLSLLFLFSYVATFFTNVFSNVSRITGAFGEVYKGLWRRQVCARGFTEVYVSYGVSL